MRHSQLQIKTSFPRNLQRTWRRTLLPATTNEICVWTRSRILIGRRILHLGSSIHWYVVCVMSLQQSEYITVTLSAASHAVHNIQLWSALPVKQLYRRTACVSEPLLSPQTDISPCYSFNMQPSRSVASSCGEAGLGKENSSGPENYSTSIATVTTEETDTPVVKKQVESTLVLNQRHLRTHSPLLGANCDDDSEAESFRDGRSEEVDRDTRDKAINWCRDFLSGSWKTIEDADFQISIVR